VRSFNRRGRRWPAWYKCVVGSRAALEECLADEPDWLGLLHVEPLESPESAN
jgi:hypothetical protein